MNTAVFPRPRFDRAIETLLRTDWPLYFTVGHYQAGPRREWLIRGESTEARGAFEVRMADRFSSEPFGRSSELSGVLQLGRGPLHGQAIGFVREGPSGFAQLSEVRLAGPGMHRIPLVGARPGPSDFPWTVEAAQSRTVGALGRPVVERLRTLKIAVIGLGRTGTRIAQSLATLGVQELVLIDPDLLEAHNLGEIDGISNEAVGQAKVDAVSKGLASNHPQLRLQPVQASITHMNALRAACSCDVLVCCSDHDSARLAAALTSSLFHRVLIDAATGIHRHPNFQMAADVRLTIPGAGCLLCVGGLSNESEARRLLVSSDAEDAFHAGRNWREERAGSLASLNQLAVSIALRALEDLVAERIAGSFWAHAEFSPDGRLTIAYPPAVPRSSALCACHLSGLGSAGLSRIPRFLQGLARGG